ncbi:MAG: hypothetical protein N4A70_08175 [Pelagimonas sp.]|jgi:hypothetical protein|nr:hypothetical protein [Pelagimonas sp.]
MSEDPNGKSPAPAADSRWLWLALALALVIALAKALGVASDPMGKLASADNDDIIRFLQVKAWFDGQGWFDGRMYQLLAPEGLDLHWSRYVDLGIAAIVWPLAHIMDLDRALGWGIVIWPVLLFVILLWATAQTARHSFGLSAAIFAVLALIFWYPTGQGYFPATRIDHHNIQILLTSGMVFTLILPGRAPVLGLIGGALAGLSLAIGLEMLLSIALAGMVVAGRAVLKRPGAEAQFLRFCLSISCVSLLAFAGQTAPSVWFAPRCDVLSLPYLALTIMGAAIATTYVLSVGRLQPVAQRLGGLILLSALGIVVLFPLIEPCFAGPYGALPDEVKQVIHETIIEAKPALTPLLSGDKATFVHIIPPLVATLIASGLWLWKVFGGSAQSQVTGRLGILLLFAWLGLIGSLSQVRLILLGAQAYPLLIGYTLAVLFALRGRSRGLLPTLGFLAVVTPTYFAPALTQISLPFFKSSSTEVDFAGQADICRKPEVLSSLNTLEKSRIFASSNLSAPMMLVSNHIGLTGPYHRSPAAMADGVLPFAQDETALRKALARTDADHLLLCRNATHWNEASFATKLANGLQAKGLTPVEGIHQELVLLKVEK